MGGGMPAGSSAGPGGVPSEQVITRRSHYLGVRSMWQELRGAGFTSWQASCLVAAYLAAREQSSEEGR